MKKHADYFVYQNPQEGFDEERLRNFLLSAFITSDPVTRSLLLQGEVNLPSLELYVANIIEKIRDRSSTILASDEISGALVGCCVAFSARQGKNLIEDLLQIFPIDMKVHYDLYNQLFQGVSMSASGKVPMLVLNVTVSPVFRHQGIATKMLETLIHSWKQAKNVNSVYVVSTGNGEAKKADENLPKNQTGRNQLFLNLGFSPLHRIEYRKINTEPSQFSSYLKTGLHHTGHHNALTLFHIILKQKKGNKQDGAHEDDASETSSYPRFEKNPQINLIPTSGIPSAKSSIRTALSSKLTSRQSSRNQSTK
ncbi:uncharacterized protein LOC142335204 [Convolutriloba macropyga]|uniref:uncharacterized protein LOC142335204 n=1 Tax=Convolutriloba macropyga TaxID=536237 RepID=UPI003F5264D9